MPSRCPYASLCYRASPTHPVDGDGSIAAAGAARFSTFTPGARHGGKHAEIETNFQNGSVRGKGWGNVGGIISKGAGDKKKRSGESARISNEAMK